MQDSTFKKITRHADSVKLTWPNLMLTKNVDNKTYSNVMEAKNECDVNP